MQHLLSNPVELVNVDRKDTGWPNDVMWEEAAAYLLWQSWAGRLSFLLLVDMEAGLRREDPISAH